MEILSDLLQEAEVKLLAEAKVFEVEMRELKLRLADEEMKLALGWKKSDAAGKRVGMLQALKKMEVRYTCVYT